MRKLMFVFVILAVVLLAGPAAFAQEGAAPAAGTNWAPIAAAFGMALAAFGGAISQAKVASSACEGMARNPGAAGAIRASMILGLVFVETLVLFTLLIVFIKT